MNHGKLDEKYCAPSSPTRSNDYIWIQNDHKAAELRYTNHDDDQASVAAAHCKSRMINSLPGPAVRK